MTTSRRPVADWATDFDHLDAEYAAHAPEILDQLRRTCPVAHTDRFHGAWLPTRYEDVSTVAYDVDTYSSRVTLVNEHPPHDVRFVAPPITTDPPDHAALRRVLLPPFSPRAVERLVPATRAACDELIDRFLSTGRADAAVDYAQHIPVLVTAKLLGLPDEDGDQFRTWVHETIEVGPTDVEVGRRATWEVIEYFRGQLDDRRRHGGDDLVAWVAGAEVNGEPLPEKEQLGMLFLLLLAGIDTTWSAIGASLWHLATHPDDQMRLRADPALLPTASEEFLRFYSPVTMARLITADTELGGCPVKAGERVLLSFPAANRDPEVFDDADRVVLDRGVNRHAAFGLGIHRCLGSNLARMELRVALEAWLARVPEFRLAEGSEVRWSAGQIRGPRSVPVVF
jgi:cytochrome P450